MRRVLAGVVAAAIALSAVPGLAQEKLTVWWVKGFYKSEDEALYAAIKKFEQKTGVKVDLSQYAVQDMNAKSVAALESGTPPDVGFCTTYDFRVTGKWAYEGKLEDVTDIIAPLSDKFLPTTTSTTYLYNDKAKRKAYYAMPIQRQTMHFNYWKDMLEEAGFKENQIPNTWNEFWGFWCDKVQPAYRKKTGKRIFAIGHPMGVAASDTFYSFLTFAAAVYFLATRSLHLSIEFTGGTVIEVAYEKSADVERIRGLLDKAGYTDTTVQNFGSSRDVLIRLPLKKGETDRKSVV